MRAVRSITHLETRMNELAREVQRGRSSAVPPKAAAASIFAPPTSTTLPAPRSRTAGRYGA